MPKQRSGKKKALSRRGIAYRELHRRLSGPERDLRVSYKAVRALQAQLYAISDHLIARIREQTEQRGRLTVKEKDARHVYQEFVAPRQLGARLVNRLQELTTQVRTDIENAAGEYREES